MLNLAINNHWFIMDAKKNLYGLFVTDISRTLTQQTFKCFL